MVRWPTLIAVGFSLAFLATVNSPAGAQHQVPGMRQADRHNPASPRYVDMRPGGFARRSAASGVQVGGSFTFFHPGHDHFGFGHGFGSPLGWGHVAPWGFHDPRFGWAPHFHHGHGPVVFAPLVLPANPLFGLGPVQRMFGAAAVVNRPPALAAIAPIPVQVEGFNVPQAPARAQIARFDVPQAAAPQAAQKPRRKVRVANAVYRQRAWKFIGYGDNHFQKQAFPDAYRRYKAAAKSAPDVVEAYLRQGQAMVAVGNYPLAARAFKRALTMAPEWSDADFQLAELYGDNQLAKNAHLEALAAAAEAEPHNGDLMLLLGVQLFFDGQAQRSRKFFQSAMRLNRDINIVAPGGAANNAPNDGGGEADDVANDEAGQAAHGNAAPVPRPPPAARGAF